VKRFYKQVSVEPAGHGFQVLLDGRPVRTPGGNALLLPTRALGEIIAGEWRDQKGEIVPVSMPMLRLANTVLDGIGKNREAVIQSILRFGEHDLVCYRAEQPPELAVLQEKNWSPLLDWAAQSHGSKLSVGTGLAHVGQPPEALAALGCAVAGMDDLALTALHVMASITGSLVLGLALAEGRIDAAEAFRLSRIDEDYQAGKWGQDAEAEARAKRLAQELDTATAFLAASRD
jgi:chaperone required for assembly of F1-ATPase